MKIKSSENCVTFENGKQVIFLPRENSAGAIHTATNIVRGVTIKDRQHFPYMESKTDH